MASRFQIHKSVHINLMRDTHAEFRINLLKRGLSMQEVFEKMAVLIVEGDSHLTKVLDELEYNKKHKIPSKKVSSADVESIFEAIEEEKAFNE